MELGTLDQTPKEVLKESGAYLPTSASRGGAQAGHIPCANLDQDFTELMALLPSQVILATLVRRLIMFPLEEGRLVFAGVP